MKAQAARPTGRRPTSTTSTARRWVRDRSSTNLDGCDVSAYLSEDTERYLQRIRVTVRNLRTQTFVTAGVACAIDSPRLNSLPLGDGTYASMSRELRRGDAYGALVYTPNPNGRERRAAPRTYPATLQRYAAHRAAAAAAARPGPGGRRATRSATGCSSRCSATPAGRRCRRSPTPARTRVPAADALRERPPTRAPTRSRAGSGASAAHAGGLRPGRDALPARRRVRLHRVAAARGREPRRLPVRRQVRLLPAVLGRDGAAAAHGRRARARLDRLHDRRCWTARRASTSCATSTPTRGWRSGTRATAG